MQVNSSKRLRRKCCQEKNKSNVSSTDAHRWWGEGKEADCGKEGGLGQDGLSGKGKAKGQEVEGQQEVMAGPP